MTSGMVAATRIVAMRLVMIPRMTPPVSGEFDRDLRAVFGPPSSVHPRIVIGRRGARDGVPGEHGQRKLSLGNRTQIALLAHDAGLARGKSGSPEGNRDGHYPAGQERDGAAGDREE